jgi:hypothetical protein
VISVIEKTSHVRKACFEAIDSIGESVRVFYSIQSFVDTGAIFTSDLVVLGRIPFCTFECEPLRWASSVRPDLATLLLGQSPYVKRWLSEVYEEARVISCEDDPAFRVNAIRKIANCGILQRGPASKVRSFYLPPMLFEVA